MTAAAIQPAQRFPEPVRSLPGGAVFAFQFLTVVPPLIRRPARPAELGAAEAFFPLVGIALGVGLVVLDRALSLQVQPPVRDAVLVTVLAAATGALHLDGLTDTVDGVFGGRDPAERLAIMRDPHVGSFGVVALALLLILKVTALGALPEHARPAALVAAPCFGRWVIVQSTWAFPYARSEGMGRGFKDSLAPLHVLIAAVLAIAAAAWLLGLAGLAILGTIALAAWAAGEYLRRRLGGLTGDTYGALCELAEAGTWLALGAAALAGRP